MVPLVTGQRVGDYELGSAASGGFRATQLSTGRDARVKVLAHGSQWRGQTSQVEAACGVIHPNIAALLDVGAEDSILYAACEWVDGDTLRQKMIKGRLPVQKAVGYAAQIASGLAAAHLAGVVHGDLKPENVVVTRDGHVKILNFAFASFPEAESASSLVADYASPEQVRGEPETAASDIFSLGVILYEMLSGTRPFLHSTLIGTTTAILKSDPPHELPPGVTPALGRIVRHCMVKAPSDRFASAADVAFALDSFWNLTIQHDKVRRIYKKGLTGVFVACLAGGIIGLGLGAAVARRYLRPVAAIPLTFRRLTGSGRDSAPSASPDGRMLVYSSDRDGVPRVWTLRLATGQETPLTSGPDLYPRISPDGKAVLFVRQEGPRDALYTVPIAGGLVSKIMDGVQGADWLPNGGFVWLKVLHTGDKVASSVGVANAAGKQPVEIAHVDQQVLAFPRCSPDGTLVAAVTGPSEAVHLAVFVTRAGGGAPHYILTPPANSGDLSSLTWALDSTNVIYFQSENRASGNGPGREWAGGGAHVIRQNAKTGGAAIIGYSQQNARTVERLGPGRLAVDSGSRRENLEEVRLARSNSHAEPQPLTLGDITDRDPVYAHDDRSIFFSSFRGGETGVWEVMRNTGASRRVISSTSNDIEPFPFSDGKRLLWSSDREGHFEIYWAMLTDPHPMPVTHDGVDADSASITPDDSWVVYNSRNPARQGVWKIRQTGIDDTRLATGDTRWPSLSPDGKYVLYTMEQPGGKRSVQVVALESGKRVGAEISLVLRRGSVGSAAGRAHWMAGGRAIAFIGQDERGRSGVYVEDFASGSGPVGDKRMVAGFDGNRAVDAFALSGDGANLVLAALDQATGIVEVSNVPGLSVGGQ